MRIMLAFPIKTPNMVAYFELILFRSRLPLNISNLGVASKLLCSNNVFKPGTLNGPALSMTEC